MEKGRISLHYATAACDSESVFELKGSPLSYADINYSRQHHPLQNNIAPFMVGSKSRTRKISIDQHPSDTKPKGYTLLIA
ncbi:unnamed protein product [Prunus armeniaca]|uniref:Uncharacterized protein n=1 Tax=Prunus armeniaca TaxID=36596 RepID=A0A6J5WDJ9_PRUAR|nr:unnamed protein product [Prunus armeniaca]CAB4296388.1 unnamed protein product [Prunus armeniaca]